MKKPTLKAVKKKPETVKAHALRLIKYHDGLVAERFEHLEQRLQRIEDALQRLEDAVALL